VWNGNINKYNFRIALLHNYLMKLFVYFYGE